MVGLVGSRLILGSICLWSDNMGGSTSELIEYLVVAFNLGDYQSAGLERPHVWPLR